MTIKVLVFVPILTYWGDKRASQLRAAALDILKGSVQSFVDKSEGMTVIQLPSQGMEPAINNTMTKG